MKVIFDTNIYISWIRERKFSDLMLSVNTQKYISSFVIMELWAGAKTNQARRVVEKLQKPYMDAKRCILPLRNDFIKAGGIISNMPAQYKNKAHNAGFVNDIFIGLNALSIGAILFTENLKDFVIIGRYLKKLKIEFV
jgi:predicted nucleic acid-binding protein